MQKNVVVLFIILCFKIRSAEVIDCLFMSQPYQDICLSKQDKHTPEITKEEILGVRKVNELNSYLNFSLGLIDTAPFEKSRLLSLSYSFKDEPWGWWQIAIESLSSTSTETSNQFWNLGLFFEKRWKFLSLFLGVHYSQQEFEFFNAGLKRSLLYPELRLAYRIKMMDSFEAVASIGGIIPVQMVFKQEHQHRIDGNDEQARLLQLVDKLDQSWSISALIGLNYLFE